MAGGYVRGGAGLIAPVFRRRAATAFSIGIARNVKTIVIAMVSTAAYPATPWENVVAFATFLWGHSLTGIQALRVSIGLLAR